MKYLSLYIYKKKKYIKKFFYRFHWILFIITIIGAAAHAGGALIGVALWGLDILIRFYTAYKHNKARSYKVLAVRLPSNVIR